MHPCCCYDKLITDIIIGAAVPGVLSIQRDENFESDNKDYAGFTSLKPLIMKHTS